LGFFLSAACLGVGHGFAGIDHQFSGATIGPGHDTKEGLHFGILVAGVFGADARLARLDLGDNKPCRQRGKKCQGATQHAPQA
jgi:hypothetical protein